IERLELFALGQALREVCERILDRLNLITVLQERLAIVRARGAVGGRERPVVLANEPRDRRCARSARSAVGRACCAADVAAACAAEARVAGRAANADVAGCAANLFRSPCAAGRAAFRNTTGATGAARA